MKESQSCITFRNYAYREADNQEVRGKWKELKAIHMKATTDHVTFMTYYL